MSFFTYFPYSFIFNVYSNKGFLNYSLNCEFTENGILHEHTYEEVNQKSNRLARIISQLIKSNALPKNSDGDYIIAVHLPPNDELVIILLAIWKAGGAYLPLDQAFPGTRIEHIMREARPAMVIFEQGKYYFNKF